MTSSQLTRVSKVDYSSTPHHHIHTFDWKGLTEDNFSENGIYNWIVGSFFGDNQLASAWGRWSSVTWVLSEGLDGGRRVDTCGHNLSPDSRNGYNLGAGNYRRNIGGDIGANCAPRDGSWLRESIVTAGRGSRWPHHLFLKTPITYFSNGQFFRFCHQARLLK